MNFTDSTSCLVDHEDSTLESTDYGAGAHYNSCVVSMDGDWDSYSSFNSSVNSSVNSSSSSSGVHSHTDSQSSSFSESPNHLSSNVDRDCLQDQHVLQPENEKHWNYCHDDHLQQDPTAIQQQETQQQQRQQQQQQQHHQYRQGIQRSRDNVSSSEKRVRFFGSAAREIPEPNHDLDLEEKQQHQHQHQHEQQHEQQYKHHKHHGHCRHHHYHQHEQQRQQRQHHHQEQQHKQQQQQEKQYHQEQQQNARVEAEETLSFGSCSRSVSGSLNGEREVMFFHSEQGVWDSLAYITSLTDMCDVVFHVGKARQPVYGIKSLLSVRSRVMYLTILHAQKSEAAATRKNGWKRLRQGRTEVDVTKDCRIHVVVMDYDINVFSQLLGFLHSGRVTVGVDTVLGLYCAAAEYEVKDLRTACWDFVERCVERNQTHSVIMGGRAYLGRKYLERLNRQFFMS